MKVPVVFYWSIVIALGGFLFGFDTAVISGAEKAIQGYWHLNTYQLGITVSIALVGTVFGALLGSIPADRLGRKNSLYLIAIIYLVNALGTSLSLNWIFFLVFRFIGGIGVGASSVTAPIYISEISPSEQRGRLVALFQFNVVFGILISYLSNFIITKYLGESSWRLMLGIQAIPAILFFILLRFVPESPRWLIQKKGDIIKALSILKIINPTNADQVLKDIVEAKKVENRQVEKLPLFSSKYKFPVFLAISLAFFNQASGINAIIYYAPRIFEMTGLGPSSSLLSTVGIGLVNFAFTLLAIRFIDKMGRRSLMLIGSFGLTITLALVSWAFYSGQFSRWGVTVYLLIYIAFFAFSQGAVVWVFIAEIFPNSIRAQGQTLGSATHWIMAALIAFSFPVITEKIGGGNTFLFFSIMMFIQLIFAWKIMPETKGKSLEQMEGAVISIH